jgi:prevent-host-death family protein
VVIEHKLHIDEALVWPAYIQLNSPAVWDILVSMTRIAKSPPAKPRRRRPRVAKSGRWLLQDAKARFSELVRRVRSEGPQRVTVHGRDEVVVISAEEFRRLKGDPTGEALIAAMQASPHRDIDIQPKRAPMPVRKVSL